MSPPAPRPYFGPGTPARVARRYIPGPAGFGMLLLVGLLLPSIAPAGGAVTHELRAVEPAQGRATFAPITATTTATGTLLCASTATGSVPYLTANARGSAAIAEPRTCPSRTKLTFHPPVQFTDGLLVPVGHRLTVQLSAVGLNGSVALLHSAHFYVQSVGGAYPIVTATQVTIFGGAITVASSSTGLLASGTTYGVGVRMSLTRLATPSTANVVLIAEFTDADGGRVNAVALEWVAFSFSY